MPRTLFNGTRFFYEIKLTILPHKIAINGQTRSNTWEKIYLLKKTYENLNAVFDSTTPFQNYPKNIIDSTTSLEAIPVVRSFNIRREAF